MRRGSKPLVSYPRVFVRLSVTAVVSLRSTKDVTVDFYAVPRSLTWERNSYLEADVATVEFDASEFPILPRNIKQVLMSVYAGDVGWLKSDSNAILDSRYIRFLGYIDDPELALSEDDGVIKFKARDYTALFLDSKRAPASLVPRYSDRLDVALLRVIDSLPHEGDERPISLELRGATEWPLLSKGAPPRAHGEKIPWKGEDSKWQLIMRICEPVNLIPRIALDRLILSPVQGLSTFLGKPPIFVFGHNIVEYHEKKNLKRLYEGVGLRAYDSTAHKYITAIYPPEGDRLITKKLPAAKAKKAPPAPPVAGSQDKRKWFIVESVSSKAQLEEQAKQRFELRAIQDFESTCKVAGMVAECVDRATLKISENEFYDMTQLEAGDVAFVDLDPEKSRMLKEAKSRSRREAVLQEQGYSKEAAQLCVQIFEGGTAGPLEMWVRKATHTISEEGYSCDIEFLSKPPGGV